MPDHEPSAREALPAGSAVGEVKLACSQVTGVSVWGIIIDTVAKGLTTAAHVVALVDKGNDIAPLG